MWGSRDFGDITLLSPKKKPETNERGDVLQTEHGKKMYHSPKSLDVLGRHKCCSLSQSPCQTETAGSHGTVVLVRASAFVVIWHSSPTTPTLCRSRCCTVRTDQRRLLPGLAKLGVTWLQDGVWEELHVRE